jgi:hypothetical protein
MVSIVTRSQGIVEAEADGEVVALNIDKGTCYGLNKVGSRIWSLIGEPKRIGDVCTTLISEYEVDGATCERQVLELLDELRAEGMIVLHEEPGESGR